ncbi:MAG: ATP-dependent sacrificial sulfur transferase LarE [Methanosarcinales archaeon]
MQTSNNISEKIENIKSAIAEKGSILIAFSGGVDSSVLSALSFQALGDNAIAVTADSETLGIGELDEAKKVAKEIGIKHIIIKFNELDDPEFAKNPPERCYYCKKGLILQLKKVAKQYNIKTIADGTNISELSGHRPGYKAIEEFGVYTPYVDFKVTKEEIREIAKFLNLSVANKPSMACVSSRFPYGHPITLQKLNRVKQAEYFLKGFGFSQLRVRDHDGLARIEVPIDELKILIYNNKNIAKHLKDLGFNYVTLDLEGFRSGSMDEVFFKV